MTFISAHLDPLRHPTGAPMHEHDHGTPEPDPEETVTFDHDGFIDHPGVLVRPCHAGRVGKETSPACIVWHCTDMAPGTGPALTRARAASAGKGNAEHFVIYEDGTTVQHVSVWRNANHAGGPDALKINGWHPNLVTLGIEMCNPGEVLNVTGGTFMFEGRAYRADTGVTREHGGYRIGYTAEQLNAARWLAAALAGAVTLGSGRELVQLTGRSGGVSYSRPVPRYGLRHSDINPYQKTDPGPQFPAGEMHAITWGIKHKDTAP